MAKILRNTTASPIVYSTLGITIPASGSYTATLQDYVLLASAASVSELSPQITSGAIVVNDGTNNLTAARGIDFIQYPDYAYANRFNNTDGNGYIATDVQAAIEETNKHLLAIEVSSTSTATTTSGTDALLTTMAITPTAGTYLLYFSGDCTSGAAGAAVSFSIYINGTQVPQSLRKIIPFSGGTLTSGNARACVSINGLITVTTGDVEIRWSTSNGTITAGARTLNLLRIT